ncbi:MAG: phosphoenolpyruvate--protein phosphotransferase [Clostridiales Family XIII bacterium]|nr:phosphoenolpyruvate--protein phosphotransferase [Clostridiales Family XIII bacterium]
MVGIGVVDGIAIQKVFIYDNAPCDEHQREYLGADKETARLFTAIETAKDQLTRTAEKLAREIGSDKAEIIEYQINILCDKVFTDKILRNVESGSACEDAVKTTCTEYYEIFNNLDNDYLQQRKIDIIDIQVRLLDILNGRKSISALGSSTIVAAEDLTPSQVAEMELKSVKGILLEKGGRSSHSVIIAQSFGIPCIIGLRGLLNKLDECGTVIMDGKTGDVIINPPAELLADYRGKLDRETKNKKKLEAYISKAPITPDGVQINVYANIASAAEARMSLENGGEGVGLFRTELLYMGFSETPSREAQFKTYSRIAKDLGSKPLIIRTLDVGGDKEIAYLGIEKEANPFLGYRAIRYCLDHESLFKDQIAAVLQAAKYGNIKLMFPMISTMDELMKAKRLVNETKAELLSQGTEFADIPIGMMMEAPAAALMADAFAQHVDFFSVGTNDLIQYLFAADRNNDKVSHLNSYYHPALFRCVNAICTAALKHEIEIDICGHAGEAPDLIPIWIAMGISGLSVSIPSIPLVKKIICETRAKDARELLDKVLQFNTSGEVKEYLNTINGRMQAYDTGAIGSTQ